MSLTFMVIADPQFGIFAFRAKKAFDESESDAERERLKSRLFSHWEQEERQFRLAIQEANRIKPDFVVICGDMVMEWDNAGQIAAVKRVSTELDSSIPLHWVPGNHDVGVDFFAPTPESLSHYRGEFGDDFYAFSSGSVRFFVINSPLFDRPELAETEYRSQLEWLRGELETPLVPDGTHRVVFSHHPPFLKTVDEEHEVYNLPLESRNILMDLVEKAGVKSIFAGHTHLNVITKHNGIEVVASGSTGYNRMDEPSGYRLVTVTEQGIDHAFHQLSEHS